MIVARLAVPVAVMFVVAMFVPVALSKNRFVKYPYTADIRLEIIFPLFWIFSEVVVPVRFMLFKVFIVVVEITPFTVDTRELDASAV